MECTASNALKKVSYDKNISTYSKGEYYRIDVECWEKYVNIDCVTVNNEFYGFTSFGSKGGRWDNPLAGYMCNITGIKANKKGIRSMKLPKNSFWGVTRAGTGSIDFRIYEIWCGEEDLTGQINK